MTLIADTNILFSAVLKRDSREFSVILSGQHDIFVCQYAIVELFKHKEKILRLTRCDEDELLEMLYIILKEVNVYNESDIPQPVFNEARFLCSDIDPMDTIFVAIALELNAFLWTGDKKLTNGLSAKGFESCISTTQILP